MKYVWNLHNSSEQLFDLKKDPQELHNCIKDQTYTTVASEMRTALAEHLKERGDSFVKDGALQTRPNMLYSPNFPGKK